MSSPSAVRAFRAAAIAGVLGLLGNGMSIVGFRDLPATPLRHLQILGLAVNALALLVLWLRRAQPSVALGNALFLVLLLPTVAMVWAADQARVVTGERWVPYEPNKLSALTLAIIAPPGWLTGLVGILMFVGSAIVHHLLMPEPIRAHMASGEPFGIIAYGAFALVLLVFRHHGHAVEAALARAQAEKLALERVAHVALSLRDLANTPTQTLELIRYALPARDPSLLVVAERMRRAIERLQRLNGILSRYAQAVPWDAGPASIDAEAEAEKLLGDRGKPIHRS